EARVALSLHHEHVVETLDVGEVDDEPYLAMEYVWGEDLRRIAERSAAVGRFLPLRFTVYILAKAARGLHYFHTLRDERGRPLGLVHRDVSPPNLMASF